MLFTLFASRIISSLLSFNIGLELVKNLSTHSADTHCEIQVARAAPLTPQPKIKINSGSRIKFKRAPIKTVFIPIFEKPWLLINAFIPVAIKENVKPIEYILKYSIA